MDPNSTGSSSKYGNWDFPEGVTFPVDVRVIVKFFKVAKCDADNETRFLNTKVIKQEISLEKQDLFSKACLLKAMEMLKTWHMRKVLLILSWKCLLRGKIVERSLL